MSPSSGSRLGSCTRPSGPRSPGCGRPCGRCWRRAASRRRTWRPCRGSCCGPWTAQTGRQPATRCGTCGTPWRRSSGRAPPQRTAFCMSPRIWSRRPRSAPGRQVFRRSCLGRSRTRWLKRPPGGPARRRGGGPRRTLPQTLSPPRPRSPTTTPGSSARTGARKFPGARPCLPTETRAACSSSRPRMLRLRGRPLLRRTCTWRSRSARRRPRPWHPSGAGARTRRWTTSPAS
mmetsp:Transcript_39749/g.113508  ORF Transcript_39749/g.113508 Transcript_39749/m.113508 type:complete len:232 (-) Transcript_39749:1032-1727(-)